MAKRLIRGRYEPQETVAGGTRGEVMRALDREHGRTVAIKVRAVRGTQHQDALQAETRMLIDLRPHQNLPLVRDGFFEGDRHHLVSDWVEGTSLGEILEQQGDPGLRFSAVIGHLRDVAGALDHLHGHYPPVVHGDVRPANVIVTPGGRAVLVGLGMDRWQERAAEPEPYRAPEIASGGAPQPAADVFGLAATAHALLSGSPPGAGVPLAGLPRAAVGVVERTLARALEADPSRRHATAHELVERLASWLETALPSGTVTFLMSDIEGSTRMWEAHRAEMSAALARHDELVADAVQRNGGLLLKTRGEGDSTFSVFERAGAAVRCAAELQRALAEERWPTPDPVRVRTAVHTGEAEIREGDYYGPVVNRCARLRAIATGGQVLVSDATRELVRDQLPDGVDLQPLGPKDLKDLARAEEVFLLVWQSLGARAAQVPPPASAARRERPAAMPRVRRPVPKRTVLVAVAAVAALAVLAGVVLAVTGGDGEPGTPVAREDVTETPAAAIPKSKAVTVPDVAGLQTSDAVEALEDAGLNPNWIYVTNLEVAHDHIITTDPGPGTSAERGSSVDMIVATEDSADLSVALRGDPSGRSGDSLEIVVEGTNLGPTVGPESVLEVRLSGLRFDVARVTRVEGDGSCEKASNGATCVFPDFQPNSSGVVRLEIVPRSSGTLNLEASFTTYYPPDPDEANNTLSRRIRIG